MRGSTSGHLAIWLPWSLPRMQVDRPPSLHIVYDKGFVRMRGDRPDLKGGRRMQRSLLPHAGIDLREKLETKT